MEYINIVMKCFKKIGCAVFHMIHNCDNELDNVTATTSAKLSFVRSSLTLVILA